jgi:ferredoxin-like protein FixX
VCGNCVLICSMNLWQKRDTKVQLAKDYKSYCLECASCFQVCEADAIDFTFPPGGYGVIYEHG